MPDADRPDDVFAVVARWVRTFRPNAVRASIEIVVPDGDDGTVKDTIAVPLPTTPDDLDARIMATLNKLRPGEWMRGKTLAAELDTSPDAGHFRRALAALVGTKLESNTNLGYRIIQANNLGDAKAKRGQSENP